MKIRMEKLCSIVRLHYKFSTFIFLSWAILGIGFSIDKSFQLLELSREVEQLNLDVKYLSDQLEESKIYRAQLELNNKHMKEKLGIEQEPILRGEH